jgi:hypothetical protein
MNPVLGYFVFLDLGNGCLGSKYGNLGVDLLLVEAAVRTSGIVPNDIWAGDFVTIWLDDLTPNGHSRAVLHIRPRTDSQYVLEWRMQNRAAQILYRGEGMVSNGQLVGTYWNEDVQANLPARPDVRQMPMVLA